MTTENVRKNTGERITAYFIDASGAPLSGLTPSITIRRKSDSAYWNGSAFQVAFAQVAMAPTDSVNQGGFYSYLFDTTGLNQDNYSIVASGTAAANSPQVGELKVGGWVDNVDAGPVGGAGVIRINGLFGKAEKERLFMIINDGFQTLFKKMESVLALIATLHGQSHTPDDADHFAKLRQEISKTVEDFAGAQVRLLTLLEKESDLAEEVGGNGKY